MKIICIILFTLASLYARSNPDHLPPHAKFQLDNKIRISGAYIYFIDNFQDHEIQIHDRVKIIESNKEYYYYFEFPITSFKIKIKFKDSTEKCTSIISNNSKYPIYHVNLDSDNNLVITDMTSYIENTDLLKFFAYAFMFFIIIKLLPTWIIIFPKNILTFLKYYVLAQLIYFLIFIILTFFFHGKGLVISLLVFLISITIDYRILNKIYFENKGFWRVLGSVIFTGILTFVYCYFLLFGYAISI